MALATLAGHRITRSRLSIGDWGCPYADVALDGEHELAGQVDLVIADLTAKGTILGGGPDKGRSAYRWVGGFGGWGKVLPKEPYADDLGVKVSKVLGDAARAAGETLDMTTIASGARLGHHFARREGPANLVLEQLAPGAWYVGEDGVTRLGRRPRTTLDRAVTKGAIDRARGMVTLATESLAGLVPGVTVDGLEAVDVEIAITEKGLRITLWGANGATTSRRLNVWRRLLEALDPGRPYRGWFEYRVTSQQGERLNLQPVRTVTGMPTLRRVRVWPGVPGCKAEHAEGSRVLVGFIDSDPSRPFVGHFEDAESEGFVPTTLILADGGALEGIARVGDDVVAGKIATGSTKARCG